MPTRTARLIVGLLIGLSLLPDGSTHIAGADDDSPLAAVRLGRQTTPLRSLSSAADESRHLNACGVACSRQGAHEQAAALFLQALEIRKDAFRETDPAYAECLNNLAVTWYRQGQISRAEPLFRRALKVLEASHGETHPDHTTCLQNLALLAADRGRPTEAFPLSCDALELAIAGLDDVEAAGEFEKRRELLAWHRDSLLSIAHISGADPDEVYQLLLTLDEQLLKHSWKAGQSPEGVEFPPGAAVAQSTEGGRPRRLAFSRPTDTHADRRHTLANRKTPQPVTLRDLRRGVNPSQSLTTLSPQNLGDMMNADSVLLDLRAYRQYAPSTAAHRTGSWSNQYVAFVVRQGHPVAIAWLGSAAAIDDAARNWTGSLEVGPNAHAHRQLRRLVWDRVQSRLRGVNMLMVVADGETSRIHWNVLAARELRLYRIEEPSLAVAASICCFARHGDHIDSAYDSGAASAR